MPIARDWLPLVCLLACPLACLTSGCGDKRAEQDLGSALVLYCKGGALGGVEHPEVQAIGKTADEAERLARLEQALSTAGIAECAYADYVRDFLRRPKIEKAGEERPLSCQENGDCPWRLMHCIRLSPQQQPDPAGVGFCTHACRMGCPKSYECKEVDWRDDMRPRSHFAPDAPFERRWCVPKTHDIAGVELADIDPMKRLRYFSGHYSLMSNFPALALTAEHIVISGQFEFQTFSRTDIDQALAAYQAVLGHRGILGGMPRAPRTIAPEEMPDELAAHALTDGERSRLRNVASNRGFIGLTEGTPPVIEALLYANPNAIWLVAEGRQTRFAIAERKRAEAALRARLTADR